MSMFMQTNSKIWEDYEDTKLESLAASRGAGSFIDEFGFDTGIRPLDVPEISKERIAEIQEQIRTDNKVCAASNRRANLILCSDWGLTPEQKTERQELLDKLDEAAK